MRYLHILVSSVLISSILVSSILGSDSKINTENQISLKNIILNKNSNMSRVIFTNKTDMLYSNFKISSSFSAFMSSHKTQFTSKYINQEKNSIKLNKLYAIYYFKNPKTQDNSITYDNIRIGIASGVIPLTGGNFKKFSSLNNVEGNGLFTLSDINIFGYWSVLSTKNIYIMIGKGYLINSEWINSKMSSSYNRSRGYFLSAEYTINNLTSKHTFQVEYYDMVEIYKGVTQDFKKLFGFGYSYDNYSKGYDIYTILTCSKNFGNISKSGNSYLLGVKKYFEIQKRDADIGFEWFRTTKNYDSSVMGSIFDNDYNDRLHSEYKIYADYFVSSSFSLSVSVAKKYTKKGESSSYIKTFLTYKF